MPRKTFTAGDILAAADVNLYLSNEITLDTKTATGYTATTSDRYKTLVFTSSSAVTLTVSTATALIAGERIDVIRDGAGSLTLTAGASVTFAGKGTAVTSYEVADRYEAASIVCVDTNTYRIIGNVSAA
jgi:hypothetical protein